MCGIVGIINGTKNRHANARLCAYLRDAIVANSLRGFDSTGIVQRYKTREHLVSTYKAAVSGTDFAFMPEVQSFLRNADDTAFTFVHNRAATRGEISEDNAHPFQHTNDNGEWLIGCHNGTLNDWAGKGDFSVDSDWALSEIAFNGVDAFEKINGAYTFVWYGHREGENTLNMVRNNARPMYCAYVKDQDRMLFGSEYMMMLWLAQRNDISLEPEIIDLEPGTLYQFSLSNPREFKKTKVPGFVAPSQQQKMMNELRAIFGRVEQKEPKPAPIVEVVTIPKKNSNKKQDKQAARKGGYITGDERLVAKHMSLAGKEVEMKLTQFVDGEAWGVTDLDGEEVACAIRQVDKATFDTWSRASTIAARIVGVQTFRKERQMALILSRKVHMSQAAATELSEAIFSHIQSFRDSNRSNNEPGTVH